MPTERKLRWATNFFIWSAAVALLFGAFPIVVRWSLSRAAQLPPLDAAAQFIGYMTGSLVRNDGPYILALINGLVLRRYKSRIAAALFALFGLIGFGLGALSLILAGINYTAVLLIVFFGAYLAIAIWAFIALMRLHGPWTRPAFVKQVGSFFQRPDKPGVESRADVYYSLIAKAMSQLPVNVAESREKVFARARAVIAEQKLNKDLQRDEQRALEEAIRRVEQAVPRDTVAENLLHQPATIWLVISMFFPRLWLIDVTCMSLYWVARIRV